MIVVSEAERYGELAIRLSGKLGSWNSLDRTLGHRGKNVSRWRVQHLESFKREWLLALEGLGCRLTHKVSQYER